MINHEINKDVEDDYMSDVFIEKSESVRPGLVTGRLAKVHKQQMLPKVVTKSGKTLQEEGRQEGLKKEIPADNIGFKLLAKMGFKKEAGLGKRGDGLKEPIAVVLKADRTGLGHLSAVKRRHDEKVEKDKRRRQGTEEEWREAQKTRANEVACERDLRTCQKACMQLDMAKGLEKPLEKFYWPSFEEKKLDEDDDEEENEDEVEEEQLTNEEKLANVNGYLRRSYFFCVWCGIHFEDENDMNSECPGDTASCHDDV